MRPLLPNYTCYKSTAIHRALAYDFRQNPAMAPAILLGSNLFGKSIDELARELRIAAGRRDVQDPFVRISVSMPPGCSIDHHLLLEVVKALLLEYGLNPCEFGFVAVLHPTGVDIKRKEHVHITICRVSLGDGAKLWRQPHRGYHKLQKAAEKVASVFRLEEAFRDLSRAPDSECDHAELFRSILNRVMDDKASIADLIRILEAQGCSLLPNLSVSGHLSGLSFITSSNKVIRGSDLGKFGLKQLLRGGLVYDPIADLPLLQAAKDSRRKTILSADKVVPLEVEHGQGLVTEVGGDGADITEQRYPTPFGMGSYKHDRPNGSDVSLGRTGRLPNQNQRNICRVRFHLGTTSNEASFASVERRGSPRRSEEVRSKRLLEVNKGKDGEALTISGFAASHGGSSSSNFRGSRTGDLSGYRAGGWALAGRESVLCNSGCLPSGMGNLHGQLTADDRPPKGNPYVPPRPGFEEGRASGRFPLSLISSKDFRESRRVCSPESGGRSRSARLLGHSSNSRKR